MPAAANKDDLIAISAGEFAKLDALLAPLDDEQATWLHPTDALSVRDIIAHRDHWIGLYLSWYEDGLSGLTVKTPAPGYKWNQLKTYNAHIYETARTFFWREIHTCFQKRHKTLLTHLSGLDDEVLYTRHLHPWMNNWPLGRWAEASGASHYRSAAKYIRTLLKVMDSLHDRP